MLVFATSDKGGTGRSVTSCNMAYQRALQGSDVCYVDFDFGSPTAGAVFQVTDVERGTSDGGLHSYLQGRITEPDRVDIWSTTDRQNLVDDFASPGKFVLYPGDKSGGEFAASPEAVRRCTELFVRLEEEFEISLIDLSAGRSHAIDMALEATAQAGLRKTTARWMVFHRWTRQHIIAAHGLVFGDHGILRTGVAYGHKEDDLRDAVRFVRTATLDLDSPNLNLRDPQIAWLETCDQGLRAEAARKSLGSSTLLGHTPLDPVLQWREQLISKDDVFKKIANEETLAAFEDLARKLTEDRAWEGL
ncbi:SCO2523 family variant P-loop protein [Kibdelosporangium aridum]|uniref:CobQ/CobB/MinD/ParA nucleotide binding domain-containing protein n=1 Tax=Kibdelosporangium aridum TaxID=2030 RepID=A0A1Y5WUD6_KIBAR|nr:SCO2523 family variant P-loop protein [Kibdelosporangium aridum]SMC51541.1 CobQ/CobB/MinD/ParA nucleotide binding domain-containing protein [Kibdelosporangium aridum]